MNKGPDIIDIRWPAHMLPRTSSTASVWFNLCLTVGLLAVLAVVVSYL